MHRLNEDPIATLAEVEKVYIQYALERLNGNKSRAARALGVSLRGLRNKLHSYGLTQFIEPGRMPIKSLALHRNSPTEGTE